MINEKAHELNDSVLMEAFISYFECQHCINCREIHLDKNGLPIEVHCRKKIKKKKDDCEFYKEASMKLREFYPIQICLEAGKW